MPPAPTVPAVIPQFAQQNLPSPPGHPPGHPAHGGPDDFGGAVRWWEDSSQKVPSKYVPPREEPEERYKPPDSKLTSLGWLRHLNDPSFPYWEHWYLQFLQLNLTRRWEALQRGWNKEALGYFWEICQVLELDRKAQLDLMMLAHSGVVGRANFNSILWDLLSHYATEKTYRDLNNLVSNQVNQARRTFDRPIRGHPDLDRWTWASYKDPMDHMRRWSPKYPLPARWHLEIGHGGVPLPPPECWGQGPQMQ